VADWQKLTQARERLDGAGDRSGSEKARQAMLGMAKGLERDPQVESLLRGRTRELGLDARMDKLPNIERRLGRELEMDLGLGRGRDLGMSR